MSVYRLLPTHPAPVHSQYLPTHICTRSTGQKHHAALEIIRTPPSPRRNPRQNRLGTIRIVDQRRIHLRRHVPGRDRVHADPLARPFVAQRLGQLTHAAFTRRVRRDRDATLERQQTCHIDDATPSTGNVGIAREHVCADVATQGEDGREIDLQDFGPVVVRELVGRMATLDAAAVEQDVNLVTVGEDLGNEGFDGGRVGEVGRVDLRGALEGLDGVECGSIRSISLEHGQSKGTLR